MTEGLKMEDASNHYFRERERAEREAAMKATCDAARWAHQEMADRYARMLQKEEPKLEQQARPA